MRIVIDAELINSYFQETVKDRPPLYSAPAEPLIDGLGTTDIAFVDDDSRIEGEWARLVEPEWFQEWFSERLAQGHVTVVSVPMCRDLIKTLVRDCGFPPDGKDRWYIATAKVLADEPEMDDQPAIVTEDLDFVAPREKGCKSARRKKLMEAANGCVAKHLKKQEGIGVRCLATHCSAGGT